MKEEWRDIIGYEGLYQVSNLGRVKSLGNDKTRKERILKQGVFNNGYCKVVLSQNNKKKNYLVHRLVAIHFLLNPQNLPQVNHKDENPSNNMVSNLEFCDNYYNANYGTRNERVGKANSISLKGKKKSQEHKDKVSKAHQKPILQLSKSGNIILRKWDSLSQASNELNINCGNISSCCNGKRKTCRGYRWMYYDDYINRMNKLYQLTLKKVS